ncbi:MAG: serine/threonine protein kinase [Armatimonadetes bacterium]|nr:serine/threonine protein kinase [Armatimonadota bacterium]
MLRVLALLLILSLTPAWGEPVPVQFQTDPEGAEVWLELEDGQSVQLGLSGEQPVPVDLSLFQGQPSYRLRYKLEGYLPALDLIRQADVASLQQAPRWPRAEPRMLIPSESQVEFHTSPRHARVFLSGRSSQSGVADEPILLDRGLFIDPVTGADQPFDVRFELDGHLPTTIQVDPQIWHRNQWPPEGVVDLQAENWEIALRYWIRDNPGTVIAIVFLLVMGVGAAGVQVGLKKDRSRAEQARRQKIQSVLRLAESTDDPYLGETFGPYRLIERRTENFGYVALPDAAMSSAEAVFLRVFEASDAEDWRRAFETRVNQMRGALDHPSTVRLIDWGEEDELIYVVTEVWDGRPLEPPSEPMSMEQALRLMRPVLEALAHAHTQGVVHRRLSPDKILVGVSGKTKLAGFEPSEADSREEYYRSPEEREGKRATSKSDQYAVGAIFYRLLSGKPAVRDPRPLSTLVPSLPRKVSSIVMRLLEEQPAARYRSLTEALAELDDAILPKDEYGL